MRKLKRVHLLARAVIVGCSTFTMSACTYFTAERVSGSDTSTAGIRIPDQKPLLILSGGQASVVMVPNPDRGTALRFGAFLAKHDSTLEFSNGVLSKISSNQDSTTLLNSLIDLAKTGVQSAGELAKAFSTQGVQFTNAFQVFDLVFDGQGNLVLLKPMLDPAAPNLVFLPAVSSVGVSQGTSTEDLNRQGATSKQNKKNSPLPDPK